nr:unnamed protein product [Haemonchus contortus]
MGSEVPGFRKTAVKLKLHTSLHELYQNSLHSWSARYRHKSPNASQIRKRENIGIFMVSILISPKAYACVRNCSCYNRRIHSGIESLC